MTTQVLPSAEEVLSALTAGDYSPLMLEAALLLRGEDQERLFEAARHAREGAFPDRRVEVRSVIEVSNVCKQKCLYCNMAKGLPKEYYLIDFNSFRELVGHLYERGRRVFLIQSGENVSKGFVNHVSKCVEDVKSRYSDITMILCLGSLSHDQYKQLREAGGDRYIIKYEASNPELFEKMRPGDTLKSRLACLEDLMSLGYKTGTGSIVGLPGQTLSDVVSDVQLTHSLPTYMMSCTTFIPADETPLAHAEAGDIDLTLNTMALLRIMNPDRLMPTTSALEKVREGGQYQGLMAGANTVTCHDGTPDELKRLFPIYTSNRVTPNEHNLSQIVSRAGLRMS